MTTLLTRSTTAVAIVLLGCLLPLDANAQARRTDSRLLVNDMTIVGMTEIQLGKMAAERASHADVKAFGQMMVKDHTEAGAELSRVAAQVKIVQPMEIDKKHAELVERLSKLQGSEFDRAYIAAMVEGHQTVVEKLKTWTMESRPEGLAPAGDSKAADQARGGPDEEAVTQWVMKTLPVVEKHLEQARELQKDE